MHDPYKNVRMGNGNDGTFRVMEFLLRRPVICVIMLMVSLFLSLGSFQPHAAEAATTPTVFAWPTASAITYGQTLESSTLTGGSASVPGSFAFTTPTTVPNAGTSAQDVTFTPTDTVNYDTVTGSVDVTVNKADPTITAWPTASAITYGQTLASSTLTGGNSSVPGSFAFTLPTTVPNAGTVAQDVTFTPTDTANYNTIAGSANVTVNKADPTVTTWPTASNINYGQTLASSTLTGGSASVPGSFAFSDPSYIPAIGIYAASVTFTPTDTTNYNPTTGTANVTVIDTTPPTAAITYSAPGPYKQGTVVTITATFDKAMADSPVPQIAISGANTLSAADMTKSTSTVYTYGYTVGAGDGSAIVSIPTGQDLSGNNVTATPTSGATFDVDNTLPVISAVSPASDSLRNNATVGYTLSESAVSGSVTFTRTGGADDPLSPHVYTMVSADMASGSHSVNTGLVLVSGSIYSVSFDAVDAAGNTATTVTSTNVQFDTTAANVALSAPAAGSRVNNSRIDFSLDKDIASGQVTYTNTGGTPDASSPHTFILSGANLTSGSHTGVDTGITTLVDGAVYTVSIDNVVDLAGNPSASVDNVNVTYDTTVVAITGTAPAAGSAIQTTVVSYTLSEQASAGTVTFTRTGGSADPFSPQTYTLSGSDLTAGSHANVSTLLTLVDGAIYTVSFDATDLAGNPATTVSNAAVIYDVSPPTDGTLNATPAGSTQIDLSWTAAIDSGSGLAPANTYKVARAAGLTAPADCSGAALYQGTALGYSDPGLAAATTYAYRVCAYDAVGNVSAGAIATATTSKLTQTITFNILPAKSYGDADFASGATASSGLTVTYASSNPAVATIVGGNIHIVGVGTVDITASQAGDAIYNPATDVVQQLTVNKADPTVTAWPTASAITYGQTLASSTLSGGTSSVPGSFAFTTPTTAPATGTAAQGVTFTPTDTTNYNVVTGSVNVTVNKADPTVTSWPTASAISYGQTLASSTLIGGTSSVPGSFAFTTPTTVPTAGTVAQGVTFTPTDTSNYNVVTGSVNVTVNKADPTVTTWPTASAITYGQTLASSTLTGGTSSVPGSFAFTTPTTVPTAGTAAQSVTFTPSDAANYNTVIGSVNVTVNKADPTVTTWPTASAITYGQTLASSTLIGGTSSVPGSFAFTTPTTAPNAGAAAQSVTFTPTDTVNYNTVTGAASVTVNQANLTVTAGDASKSYGAANPALTVSYSGFVNGETAANLTTQPIATTAAITGSPAGSYPITASGGVSNNYSFTYISGTLTITPVVLTVTADDKSKAQGANNPPLTLSYSGFVNGDTLASLTTQPVAATTATISSPVGSYPITVSGGVSANYTFNYVSGTLTVVPADASSFTVTGFASTLTAGGSGSVTVTAKDPYGNTAIGYTGTIHFTSSDPQAVLPADYTFVAGDAGIHTFTGITLRTSGNQSVSVADTVIVSITGSQSGIVVNPAAASSVAVTGLVSPRTAGSVGTITVTAKDIYGNTATGYTGTVHFSSSDSQAVLPADYTFVAGDAGVSTFSGITLRTTGTQSITVTDTVTVSITGSQSGIVVNPATAATLIVSGITSPRTAGPVSAITITARDAYGNTATGYTGTIHFTSTDSQATLPADYTFTAGDAGVHSFSSAILKTAGTWSVTAADTVTSSINGSQTGIVVNPAATSTLVISGLTSPRSVGTPGTMTVVARDIYGNTTTGYTGTVRFTSTDPLAILPANYTFAAGDAGVHTFSSQITLKTVGTQSVTVTDTVVPTINGTQSGISVIPATASTLVVAGFASPTFVNAPGTITVTAKDANGNAVEGYRGTIHFTSTDPQAILPADYTFVAGDAGVHTFVYQITLKTVGTQSITATDQANATINGTQAGIVVNVASLAMQSAQVVAGAYHTVALDTSGHVLTWGNNDAGQLGIGTTNDEASPVTVPTIDNIIAIAAGNSHTVALKNDGTVWTWGSNGYGQLGNGTIVNKTVPTQVQGLSGIIGVAAGEYYTMALKSDGTVWTWGDNAYGQLGYGSINGTKTTPVQVYGILDVAGIAAGGYHSLFLKGDGTVWSCGNNNSGQLGDGTNNGRTVPVQVSGLDSMAAVAGGLLHSVALRKDGTVWVWGDNSRGQIGNGTTTNSNYPVQLSTISDATGITAGDYHSAALRYDGIVWTWGSNSSGQLGDGSNADRYTPAQVQGLFGVLGIAGGGKHTVAVRGNGTIWAWGDNTYGQLGDGFEQYKPNFVPVQSFTGTLAVASGAEHNVAVKTDGTVWTWGKNAYGQLGDGTLVSKSLPLQVTGLTGIISVAAGSNHTVALSGSGNVWAWGANASGQLGDGTTSDKNRPVQVPGLTGITAIAAGDFFTLALKSDGTVWAWGANNSGQLGDNSTTNRSAPVMVSGLAGVSKITAGYLHSMALKLDGTVWTWGYNSYGQLGDGTNIFKKTPVQTSLSQVTEITAGTHHSMALKSDGTLWAWGYNALGQLGDGSTANTNAPEQIINISGVSAIAAGAYHSMALKNDGTVWTWGDNYFGQLGDNTVINKSLPQQLTDFSGITAIAAGGNHSAIVKGDSSIWMSGNNSYGQLGDGTPYAPGIVPSATLGNDTIPPVTTASLGDGTYAGSQTVMLIANEPSTIRYTTDGTTPDMTSPVYNAPIQVAASTILKFFAVDLSGNVETVKTRNYTITTSNSLSIAVNGSGRVDLSIGGSCSSNCSQSLPSSTTVVLTPVAGTGSNFISWSGCDSVNGQLCTVTMSTAKMVTATFSNVYPLSLVIKETGTVNFSTGGSCTGNCTRNLAGGTTVVMTASPDSSTIFEGWGGCDTTTGNSCTVTMNGARSITAIFGYLVKSSVSGYLSLQNAYITAPNNDILLLRAANLSENVNLNRNVSITLSGGYDSSYSSKIGQTTLSGTLTVTSGAVTVEDLVIE